MSYPRKIDDQANIDETAPYFIERNEEFTAFRCVNRHYEILAHSKEQNPWFQMSPASWHELTNLCNEKSGWHLQGNCIFLYQNTESEICDSKGYKIIPVIEKQLRILSQCFHNKYHLGYFDCAVEKWRPVQITA